MDDIHVCRSTWRESSVNPPYEASPIQSGNQKKKTRFVVFFFLTGLWPVLSVGQWLPSKPWPEEYTILHSTVAHCWPSVITCRQSLNSEMFEQKSCFAPKIFEQKSCLSLQISELKSSVIAERGMARLYVPVLPLGYHLHSEAWPEWECWSWPGHHLQGEAWPDCVHRCCPSVFACTVRLRFCHVPTIIRFYCVGSPAVPRGYGMT